MSDSEKRWDGIISLVSEIRRCERANIHSAALALSYICIDCMASLAREEGKAQASRSDFKAWVSRYLVAHESQKYQYKAADVYAARCAYLHTYGSKAELHSREKGTKLYGYHDGSHHIFNEAIDQTLILISVRAFVNDVINAVDQFLEDCGEDAALRKRVESRIEDVISIIPVNNDPSR